jgi:hypothetical protein
MAAGRAPTLGRAATGAGRRGGVSGRMACASGQVCAGSVHVRRESARQAYASEQSTAHRSRASRDRQRVRNRRHQSVRPVARAATSARRRRRRGSLTSCDRGCASGSWRRLGSRLSRAHRRAPRRRARVRRAERSHRRRKPRAPPSWPPRAAARAATRDRSLRSPKRARRALDFLQALVGDEFRAARRSRILETTGRCVVRRRVRMSAPLRHLRRRSVQVRDQTVPIRGRLPPHD